MSTPKSSALTIGIVVGEASGDTLAAGLIQELTARYPSCQFIGIAGPKMQALGAQSLYDMDNLSVMGLVEVLKRLRPLLKIRKGLVDFFTASPPDLFIGVDAPDFNLPLEKMLKARGIKTVHYVSPSVWAWRQKRVHQVAKATDMVLSLFPFEKQFYDVHKVPCTFVGHTLASTLPMEPDVAGARKLFKLEQDDTVVALLPGSRESEIAMLLPLFLLAVDRLEPHYENLVVLIPVINRQRKQQIERQLQAHRSRANIRVIFGHATEVMTAADAVLMASGTATLEAMLCKKPMVVAYRFKALTFWLLKQLVKTPYVAIPNILAGQGLVPELLQDDANPEALANALMTHLDNDSTALVKRFTELHQTLGLNADEQAADAIEQLLDLNPDE